MVAALVGNSSAGIIETPCFGLPAVNVGRRQHGRLAAENVIHVGHDRQAIAEALRRAVEDPVFRARAAACCKPYGDGRAGERVVEVLRRVALDSRLLVKRMSY